MINILLAEDDVQLNNVVSLYLKNAGYSVKSCFDGEEALSVFEQEKIDLVLSDIMMPKMDGFTLARSIRLFNAEVPIIFITAKDDTPSKLVGYGIGIDDYVVKPFDLEVLLAKIKTVLRRAKI